MAVAKKKPKKKPVKKKAPKKRVAKKPKKEPLTALTLRDAPVIHETRAQAEAYYAKWFQWASEQENADHCKWIAMRWLAKNCLFYLMTKVMKRYDMNNDFCFEMTQMVKKSPNGHLDLWARGHYKTSIITHGMTIQDILLDPEITIGLFSFNSKMAKQAYAVILNELENNEFLKYLFPDILYSNPRSKNNVKWTEEEGFDVKREGNPRERTLQAFGLTDGQMPTGAHFMLRVYDDIITEKHVTNPDQIKKARDQWRMSLNLNSKNEIKHYPGQKRIFRYVGTRYHFNDLYGEIKDKGIAIAREYPGTKNGKVNGEPVFWDREELDKQYRDMGPYIFSCQILLNPIADEAQGFNEEWLQHINPERWREFNRYIIVDPAHSKKKENDYTVMWVVGLGSDRNYYVIDGIRDRLNLTERTERLFKLHRQYLPISVGYERYGAQSDIEHIQDRMNQENYRFQIHELGGNQPKNDRIRKLIPLFENGRIFFPHTLPFLDYQGRQHNMVAEFKAEEYLAFPVSRHDDMLDCLARIVDPEFLGGDSFPQDQAWGSSFTQQHSSQQEDDYDMWNHNFEDQGTYL